MNVSRETHERLRHFHDLLLKWTARINLVAPSTAGDAWDRHIRDSAQLFGLAPNGWRHWCDLGSGGGLPGVVVAILATERDIPAQITLIESDARKAAFLRTALRETGARADVVGRRIEAVRPQGADVVSARALAPLPRLLDLAAPHLALGGIGLFPKGKRAPHELAEALERWTFACEKIPSTTDPDAVILKIGELERA